MANQKEIDKLTQAADYFNRYYEFQDAVKVSEENKEYLKTYIQDTSTVTKNFDLRNKILKGIAGCAAAALVVYFLLFSVLDDDVIFVAQVACGSLFVLGAVFIVALNKYRLTAAEKNQEEVNEGIEEQLDMLSDRTKLLEKQRDDYYTALQKRVDFMSLDYMKNVEQIKEYLVSGQAETCEDAVEMFEQNLLMQQMTNIITQSEIKEPVVPDNAKEKFGDPLKLIKENKRKKRKEKRKKATA